MGQNNMIADLVTGIKNGYVFSEDELQMMEKLLYEGFKMERPNSNITLGPVGCYELLAKLIQYIQDNA